MMDINTIRIILLVICFSVFIGIVWWAYSSKHKTRFEEAALLPFNEDLLKKTTDEQRD